MSNPTYNLFSLVQGEPNVGLWLFQQQEQQEQQEDDQPVLLDAVLVDWVASKGIVGSGPTGLSAGPFKYTYERNGVVFATNDPSLAQDWFLIPINDDSENTYIIATDQRGVRVWTAGAPKEPISIRPTGGPNQLLKFKRVEYE